MPFQTLLETTGRTSGEPRRTPLGGSRIGDAFCVRLRVRRKSRTCKTSRRIQTCDCEFKGRWHRGTAHLLPDDDPHERLRSLPQKKSLGALIGTEPLVGDFRSLDWQKSKVTFSFMPVQSLELTMESFVHLRKGNTPRRLHADLDGLKDDELGRGGFTGRTANMYRRNDPTAYRSTGPLKVVDVLASELKPSDATDATGSPMLLFSNVDCRISLSRRAEEMPFYTRHVDGDLLSFVHRAPACWRPSSGRCATGRATGYTSRRRRRGASCPTMRRRF